MRRQTQVVLAALIAVIGALLSAATTAAAPIPSSASSAVHESPLNDPEEDCLEPVPEAAGVSGATDAGQTVKLEVWVLLDDMTRARADEVMTRAAETYAPVGIDLVVAGYQRIRI